MHRSDQALESFLPTLPQGLKHVFEFRHESWLNDGVFEILRKHGVGFCVFDLPTMNCPLLATADFAYIRFHGNAELYSSSYSDEELAQWAEKLVNFAPNLKSLYVYFNNDTEAFAVKNATTLRRYLGLEGV